MAKIDRKRVYPQIVEQTFTQHWPGFAELKASDRAHLTMLLCSAARPGKYAHSVYEGFISYYYLARDNHFGRGGFQTINADLKLFDVEEGYRVGSFTKGYRLTAKALAVLETVPQKPTALVDSIGQVMQTPAKFAVSEKDINGNHRRGTGNFPAVVAVDLDGLQRLEQEALHWKWYLQGHHAKPAERRLQPRLEAMADNRQRLTWIEQSFILQILSVNRRADTVHLPRGHIEVTYTEFTSGRLYATGGLLQATPREIRNTAFKGYFDYDISNAHFGFVRSLAERCGIDTPAISDYL